MRKRWNIADIRDFRRFIPLPALERDDVSFTSVITRAAELFSSADDSFAAVEFFREERQICRPIIDLFSWPLCSCVAEEMRGRRNKDVKPFSCCQWVREHLIMLLEHWLCSSFLCVEMQRFEKSFVR